MQEGNNIVDFGKELRGKIDALRPMLPPDLKIDLFADQPTVVKTRMNDFIREFGIAIVAVILVTMVLLPFRVAIISAVAIPVTISITFGLLNAFGIELHQVSICGADRGARDGGGRCDRDCRQLRRTARPEDAARRGGVAERDRTGGAGADGHPDDHRLLPAPVDAVGRGGRVHPGAADHGCDRARHVVRGGDAADAAAVVASSSARACTTTARRHRRSGDSARST